MAKQPSRRVRRSLAKYVRGQNQGWTPAQVKVGKDGNVAIKVNPDSNFAKCVERGFRQGWIVRSARRVRGGRPKEIRREEIRGDGEGGETQGGTTESRPHLGRICPGFLSRCRVPLEDSRRVLLRRTGRSAALLCEAARDSTV